MNDDQYLKLSESIAELRIAVAELRVAEMNKVAQVADIAAKVQRNDERLQSLERFKAQILMAVAVSGALGGIASTLLQWMAQ